MVALLILAARSTLADHYVVPTGSMTPTLVPGDRVLVDKTAYGLRVPFTGLQVAPGDLPRRGDVVIFDSPEDGTRLIKRVAALPGDEIAMHSGRLMVNGHVDGRAPLDLRHGGGPNIEPQLVPEGHLLVLGDSRGNSRDSRFFGFIPVDALYAKALGVYYRSGKGLVWRPLVPAV